MLISNGRSSLEEIRKDKEGIEMSFGNVCSGKERGWFAKKRNGCDLLEYNKKFEPMKTPCGMEDRYDIPLGERSCVA